jgi:Ubiquitin carboxyl-terminal hydrolase
MDGELLSPPTPPPARGIPNAGNTCYAAAVAQALARCACFRAWVLGGAFDADAQPACSALQALVRQLAAPPPGPPPDAAAFLRGVRRSAGVYMDLGPAVQNDAHEFAVQLLSLLLEECRARCAAAAAPAAAGGAVAAACRPLASPRGLPPGASTAATTGAHLAAAAAASPALRRLAERMDRAWDAEVCGPYGLLGQLLHGQAVAQVQCGHCGALSHASDVFTFLAADVPSSDQGGDMQQKNNNNRDANGGKSSDSQAAGHDCNGGGGLTVWDCLLRSFGDARIDELWQCERCNGVACAARPATRTVRAWRLPPVLLVALRRFDAAGRKVATPVRPVLQLDPSSLCSAVGPAGATATRYAARALVLHSGSAARGHYTALLRQGDCDRDGRGAAWDGGSEAQGDGSTCGGGSGSGAWLHADDDAVTPVAGGGDPCARSPHPYHARVYLAVYEALPPP